MSVLGIFCGHLCVNVLHRVAIMEEFDFGVINGSKAQVVQWRFRIFRILGGGQQFVLSVIVLGEQFHFSIWMKNIEMSSPLNRTPLRYSIRKVAILTIWYFDKCTQCLVTLENVAATNISQCSHISIVYTIDGHASVHVIPNNCELKTDKLHESIGKWNEHPSLTDLISISYLIQWTIIGRNENMRVLFCGHKQWQIHQIIWTCDCIFTDRNKVVMLEVRGIRSLALLRQLGGRVDLIAAAVVIEPCHWLAIRWETEVGNFQWIWVFVLDEWRECVFDINSNITGYAMGMMYYMYVNGDWEGTHLNNKSSTKPVVISISAFNGQLLLRISSVYENISDSSCLLRNKVVRLFSQPPKAASDTKFYKQSINRNSNDDRFYFGAIRSLWYYDSLVIFNSQIS